MFNLSNAVNYHYNQFPPSDIHYQDLIKELLEATEMLARYDQLLCTLHNREILLAPLRSQEAVISSRIEGTISTIDEILELEAQYSDEEELERNRDTRSEVVETLLYQRALKTAQKNIEEGYSISHNLIRQMHQQLLSIGRGSHKSPGQYKTEQNYLGDKGNRNIKFIPISPEALQQGLDNLFDYLKNNKQHPELLKTAFMHLEFEALHPFKDGNGRIGRMLITLYLWQAGLISSPHFYISGYLEEHKDEYISAMRAVSQENEWTQWAIFFLNAVKNQAEWNCKIAENIRQLYEEMKVRITDTLSSKWSIQVCDYLFTYPKFRGSSLYSNTEIPKNTATQFLKKLVDEGIIIQQIPPSGRKAALYSFEPLLELVRV